MRRLRFIPAVLVIAVVATLALFGQGCTGARCANCGKTVKTIVLNGVNFDFNKYEIRPEGKALLDKDLTNLKQDKSLDISIEGHCDIVGNDEYNQKLSERRARVVYDYFLANGIEAARMRTVGYGRTKPIVPNDTAENRAKNRRVEINIIKARK